MSKELTVDGGGAIVYNGRIIGEFKDETIILNAGWCRLAEVGIRVDGDTGDRRRTLLERPAKADTKSKNDDQPQLPEATDRPVRGSHPERQENNVPEQRVDF